MLALALVASFVSHVPGALPPSLEPVAVAPWKNLNGDAALAWLEQGAAETMAADLKRAGVDVVERTQIAEALAQVAASAKGAARDDVASAVAAGRIAGARSIVLGSFQTSGKSIRLTSRIVDVETGRVADAAQATGALADIFALQDDVVGALAKRAGKPRAAKPRRPQRASSLPAYAAFSRSLTAPDGQRRALLEEALRLDPALVYARDALAALEARLREAAPGVAVAWDARQRELLALVDDSAAAGDRRLAAARALLADLEGARRFRALLAAADRLLAAGLPRDVIDDVDERASAARVLALARLVRIDLALQAGEKHFAAFPAGARRGDVEALVRELVDERRSLAQRRAEYDTELAEVAGPSSEDADWRRCIAAKWSRLGPQMVQGCAAFLARFPRSEHAAAGRAFIAWGHALQGDFAAARAAAAALEKDIPGALDDTGLRAVMPRWSAD